jgi:hypothetical protein
MLGRGIKGSEQSNSQALRDLSDLHQSLNARLHRIQLRRSRAAADAKLWAGEVVDDEMDGLLRAPRDARSRLEGPSDSSAQGLADSESFLLGGLDDGYAPPTLTELFPVFILSAEGKAYVVASPEHYVIWNTRSLYHWAMHLTISRRFTDVAIRTLTGFDAQDEDTEALPFRAVWQGAAESADAVAEEMSNAPQPGEVPSLGDSRSGMLMPWLGCRCAGVGASPAQSTLLCIKPGQPFAWTPY